MDCGRPTTTTDDGHPITFIRVTHVGIDFAVLKIGVPSKSQELVSESPKRFGVVRESHIVDHSYVWFGDWH
jgi:hypothetical protein